MVINIINIMMAFPLEFTISGDVFVFILVTWEMSVLVDLSMSNWFDLIDGMTDANYMTPKQLCIDNG